MLLKRPAEDKETKGRSATQQQERMAQKASSQRKQHYSTKLSSLACSQVWFRWQAAGHSCDTS
jgi:hypothetical protein